MKTLTIIINERKVELSPMLTAALLSQIVGRRITASDLVKWEKGGRPMPADVQEILNQTPVVE